MGIQGFPGAPSPRALGVLGGFRSFQGLPGAARGFTGFPKSPEALRGYEWSRKVPRGLKGLPDTPLLQGPERGSQGSRGSCAVSGGPWAPRALLSLFAKRLLCYAMLSITV
eukprot:1298990-Pyramimonas_sp.AAC.1